MRIMANTIESIVNYYIKNSGCTSHNKLKINKCLKTLCIICAKYNSLFLINFLLSDMGAIDPIILTLSLIINVSVFMFTHRLIQVCKLS